MKNVSFVFAVILIAFSIFGCNGDSSWEEPPKSKIHGIVSGTGGLLVLSNADGTQWSQADVPEDLSQADFTGVAFSPGEPNKAWVASSKPPAIMTSTDAGKTWTRYEGELYDCVPICIQAADTKTAWISCFCNGNQPLALKTGDGGETWVLQEAGPPLAKDAISLQGLSVVSPQVAWMSGGYGPSNEHHGIVLRTVDGGTSWEVKVELEEGGSQLPADLPFLGVSAKSPDEAWVVSAHNSTQGSSVYHTADGGFIWTLQKEDLLGDYDLNAVEVVEDTVWTGGDYGNMARSVDSGASWGVFHTGAAGMIQSLAALDGTTAWAVSSGGFGISTPQYVSGEIVNTNDGGKTWNKLSYPGQSDYHNLSHVAFEKEY